MFYISDVFFPAGRFDPTKLRKEVTANPSINSDVLLQLASFCEKHGYDEASVELVAASIVQGAIDGATQMVPIYDASLPKTDEAGQKKPSRLRFASDTANRSPESANLSELIDHEI